MKKFLQNIWNAIGLDGVAHFAISALIVVFFDAFAPVWVGILVALLLGAAKELYDFLVVWRAGEPYYTDRLVHDVNCDLAGIVVGIAIVALYLI